MTLRRVLVPLVVLMVAFAAGLPIAAAGSRDDLLRRSLDHRVARHVLESRVVGHSVRGRAIRAVRLGDPTSPRKVVLIGAIHGSETGPSRLLTNLRDGRRIEGADVWVIRFANPDGVASHRRQNAHGVDLNRNFPRKWAPLSGNYYSGSGPASEPETGALMAFLREIRPAYVVSFHQPLYGVGRTGLRRGRALERRLSRRLHLPLKAFNCTGACHGTMTEWFNHALPGVAITVEYGHGMTRRQLRTGPDALLRAVGAHR